MTTQSAAMRFGTLVVVLAVVLLHAEGAQACERLPAELSMWEFPAAGTRAPRNTRVALLVRIPPVRATDPQLQRYEGASLVCVTAGAQPPRATPIPIERRRHAGHRSVLLELVPNQVLPAGAHCAVVAAGPPKEMLSWFEVTEAVDRSPPAMPRIRHGRLQPSPPDPCDLPSGDGAIEFDPPKDDTADAEGLLYAVWIGKEDGPIDYEATPTTWLLSRTGREGQHGVFFQGDHEDGFTGSFPVPSMGTRIRIGIRLVDLAGHSSAPAEAWVNGIPTNWQGSQLQRGALKGLASFDIEAVTPYAAPRPPEEATPPRFLLMAIIAGLLAVAVAVGLRVRRQRSRA